MQFLETYIKFDILGETGKWISNRKNFELTI